MLKLIIFNRVEESLYVLGERVQRIYKEDGEEKIELVDFANYSLISDHLGKLEARAVCQLTQSQYLVLILGSRWEACLASSFQDLMTESMWFLIDLETKSVNTMNPIVHTIGQPEPTEFKTVYKKRANKHGSFGDGDLNGGFSQPIAIPENFQYEDPQLIAFRPFTYNPDLFQIQLYFGVFLEMSRDDYYGSAECCFYTLKFIFKLKNEAIFEIKSPRSLSDVKLCCYH